MKLFFIEHVNQALLDAGELTAEEAKKIRREPLREWLIPQNLLDNVNASQIF